MKYTKYLAGIIFGAIALSWTNVAVAKEFKAFENKLADSNGRKSRTEKSKDFDGHSGYVESTLGLFFSDIDESAGFLQEQDLIVF